MACCPSPSSREDGYATPAALVFAVALALIASALVARSVMELRQARADLEKALIEIALDGAHLQAAADIIRAGDGGPYRWAFSTDAGWVDALAEPEVDKLPLKAAADLPDEILAGFQVADSAALRARAGAAEPFADVAGLDASAVWKRCAPRLMSGFGQASAYRPATASEPGEAVDPDWRVAEVWRIRLTTATGWRDDRIVRFTGDARHPAAVVQRRLSRSDRGEGQCDDILAAVAAARTATP